MTLTDEQMKRARQLATDPSTPNRESLQASLNVLDRMDSKTLSDHARATSAPPSSGAVKGGSADR